MTRKRAALRKDQDGSRCLLNLSQEAGYRIAAGCVGPGLVCLDSIKWLVTARIRHWAGVGMYGPVVRYQSLNEWGNWDALLRAAELMFDAGNDDHSDRYLIFEHYLWRAWAALDALLPYIDGDELRDLARVVSVLRCCLRHQRDCMEGARQFVEEMKEKWCVPVL